MLKGKFSSRRRVTEEVDAMSGLANLSDVMLVFACGLMAAVILNWNVDLSKTRVEIKPIAVGTVTISISCVTLLNHLDVYEGDANAIPKGGEILPAVSVELYENDTAYTLLKRVCREKNIEVDGEWDADSAYITQIGSVSEFTAGPLSAWLFTVNGTIPDVDSQSHPLEDGDVVEWHYTCDFGNDIAEGMQN